MIWTVPTKIQSYNSGKYSVRVEKFCSENEKRYITYFHFTSKGKAMLYFNKRRKEVTIDRVSLFDGKKLWLEESIDGKLIDFINK